MNEQTTNREVVLKVLNETIRAVEQDRPRTRGLAAKRLNLRSVKQWSARRDEIVGRLQRAQDWAEADQAIKTARVATLAVAEEPVYVPRNRTLALLQSAMDEYLEQKATKAKDSRARRAILKALFEQFDTSDPGWISVAFEKLRAIFTRNASFIRHKTVTDFRFELGTQTRIAMVGDWGTGTGPARAVAEQIKARNPDHVIHLGDVYYSGTEREVEDRFLKIWRELQIPAQFWALNSNHEMYSGGHGYFKKTLKEFKQPASYFSLENEHWRIIGLDSGYVDHNFNKEQVEWLSAQLDASPVKTILLTHHQLFSAFQEGGERMEEKLDEFLRDGRIFGWFWGHEHKCIVYQPHKNLKARCIGHGGIPYTLPPAEPANLEVPTEFVDRRPRPDNPERGLNGFALLTLESSNLHVDYIDQNGAVAFQEDL
jgi:hypothetical protein